MKRLDGLINFYALNHDLPPVKDRPNPATAACINRWVLHLPGYSVFWNCYCLAGCHLREVEGTPLAIKHFPEATHEIVLFALDPDHDQETLRSGGIAALKPTNYCKQVSLRGDEQLDVVLRELCKEFVAGRLIPEPVGINGARELFDAAIERFVRDV